MRVSIYIATSVDGSIARPDGGLDWLSLVAVDGEDYGYAEFFESVDALLIGRKTYDTACSFAAWPYAGKRCVVLTHRTASPKHGAELVTSTPAETLARLRADGARHVYIDGGTVIRACLDANLVDHMTLSLIPVVLREGVKLFANGAADHRLTLRSATPFPSGLVQLRYTL